jgi:methylated-DNA-[protein]-cysteine S-methyltransferase
MSESITWFDHFATPVGELLIAVRDDRLLHVEFAEERHPRVRGGSWHRDADRVRPARVQIDEYFAGARTRFDLTLSAEGTAFQRTVWAELSRIPYGQTISYGELARRIGNPRAVRAVGLANGRNPLPIVVPCHRVIGADGSLTGFGGGIERKRWLLEHEARVADGGDPDPDPSSGRQASQSIMRSVASRTRPQ